MKTLWKVFGKNLTSDNGNIKWEVGKWQKHKGKLKMCQSGFHASEKVIDAMQYTNTEEIAQVEVHGEHLEQSDKQVWSEMKVLKVYDWTKEDSVRLAIFAAELVIQNFEREYPNDESPRQAIEAAKKWLRNPNKQNQSAAWSAASVASTADATWSGKSAAACAAYATASVAWSAAYAADATEDAAAYTADAIESAAWSAASVAYAAYDDFMDKCEDFIQKILQGRKPRDV